MATKPRSRSESGFYHVFQRGVSLFDIFEDDEDRQYYLDLLKKNAVGLNVEVHSWCLMSNHVHLLLKSEYDALSAFMRQLGSSYAKHFNARHHRSGPLFEGRFCSVCVEDDVQFMTVLRYIHRNPIRHEESTLCGSYPWSSYREYVSGVSGICTLGFAQVLFGDQESFVRFHDEWDDRERLLDVDTYGPLRDDEARLRANGALEQAGFDVSVSHIGNLPRSLRDKALVCVKSVVGCSLRQLQRLTAIAYSAIRNALLLSEGAAEDERCAQHAETPKEELIAAFSLPRHMKADGWSAFGGLEPTPLLST